MSGVEIFIFTVAVWFPLALAYYIRRQFAAEFERYLAQREAERQRDDQVLAGGAATEVGQIREE